MYINFFGLYTLLHITQNNYYPN